MKPRPIRVDGDVAYVPLTRGYEAVIDAADVPLVEGWNWSVLVQKKADGTVRAIYAQRCITVRGKDRIIRMHRVIAQPVEGLTVDHIDGNGLNNRRSNLRLATQSQNSCNRKLAKKSLSGVKGVSFHTRSGKWQARIFILGQLHCLGTFETVDAAAAAYASASKKHHGEFGRTS